MIDETELITVVRRLEVRVLHTWIEEGLVAPRKAERGYLFDEADVARVNLICDLCFDMGVGPESLPIILSLIDQLHRTRHSLKALAAAIEAQPEGVRSEITVHAKRVLGVGEDEKPSG